MLRKMVFIFMGVLFVMMTTPGCIRVNTVTRERVDMEVDGNQGYLVGEGTFQPKEPRKRTKTFIKIDIDLSGFQDLEEPEKEKAIQEIEPEELDEGALKSSPVFNKGYVFHKDTEIEEVAHGYTEEYSEIEIIEPEPEKEISFIIYTVKKNESLWDIAARPEIYGNPSKWKLIYEANKDSIKKPNLIRPGMKLKIPQIEP